MSYLITAHVFRNEPHVARLDQLPKSIGYRVYRHESAGLYVLDTFRASKVPAYPFQTLLPSVDIPLELPSGLDVLERLYLQLSSLKLANSFKKSYVTAALLLNRLVEQPVFSFVSDDDLLDFTCSAADGALSRLRCRCGDLVITCDGQTVQITPLVPEDAMDEEWLTDIAGLRSALPGVDILPRTAPWNTQLHWIAIEELRAFGGIRDSILGLGTFDPPEDESAWQLVVSR